MTKRDALLIEGLQKLLQAHAAEEVVESGIDVVLRLDSNCTEAPEDDPLTIDMFAADSNYEKLLHSFSVSDLIKEMIRSRTASGILDDPDSDKPDPFPLIRDELRHLADLIDAALLTREVEKS